MRIDAHQYFWVYDPVRHASITEDAEVLRRDFLPTDLEPLLGEAGMDGTVALQADESRSGTEFLLGLADAYPFVRGVVGRVDFTNPALYDTLEFYSQFEKLKGFLHSAQPGPEGVLQDPSFLRGVRQLTAFDFTFDLPGYLYPPEELADFVGRLAENRVAISLSPTGDSKETQAYRQQHIRHLAAYPHAYCKIPGTVAGFGRERLTTETLTPALDFLLETFGPDRLIFGSGWPVCLTTISYPQEVSLISEWSRQLTPDEQQKIFGANALYFYNLEG